MNILIWGLGYVGSVSAACLANLGHRVIGVDSDVAKVEALNAGRAPILEPGLDAMVRSAVAAGNLQATGDGAVWVGKTDISLICVGTPSAPDGSADLTAMRRVVQTIGRSLRDTTEYHTVVVRSTVWPGTTCGMIRTILEAESGKQAVRDFGLAMNPEFLREGSAVSDFHAPPYHIIGELDSRSGSAVAALYAAVVAPNHHIRVEEAEIMKVVNNAFHALKIGFANEIGSLCTALELDARTIMNLVCADRKLNISPSYLRPGPAFGGSCLPKDLRNLLHEAHQLDLTLPILEGVLPSNHRVIERARQQVRDLKARHVCVLGVSFKPGTDDVRESPALELICGLRQDGIQVRAYDPDLELTRLTGSNLAYLCQSVPDFADMLCPTLAEALSGAEAVVICKEIPEFLTLRLSERTIPILKASCVP